MARSLQMLLAATATQLPLAKSVVVTIKAPGFVGAALRRISCEHLWREANSASGVAGHQYSYGVV